MKKRKIKRVHTPQPRVVRPVRSTDGKKRNLLDYGYPEFKFGKKKTLEDYGFPSIEVRDKPGKVKSALSDITLAIVGSRTTVSYAKVSPLIQRTIQMLEEGGSKVVRIHSGGARGADTCAAVFAREHRIPLHEFKPKEPRARYYHERNQQIVDNSTHVLAFWENESTGTLDTIKRARKRGLPIYICRDVEAGKIEKD